MLPRLLAVIVASTLGFAQPLQAQGPAICSGSSVFVEEMDSDLDGFIRAEFVKQHLPLKVVLDRATAHLVLVGTSSGNEKRSWHEGWLTSEKDHATGNVAIVERSTNSMLWAAEAGDRSLWWGSLARGGQRKVASRLVKDLKKAIRGCTNLLPPVPLTPEEIAAAKHEPSDTTHQTDVARMTGTAAPMTNEDVLKMVDAGLGDALVVDKIKASSTAFDLSTEKLIDLKKAGVSDTVLTAMVERQKH